jgi:iron(III) transport system ATP-binding protein
MTEPTSPPSGLGVAGVRKAFGPQMVLRGIDLVVPPGSFTAILGASGSGKTTLLRILAGLERADSGAVTIGDVLVEGDRRHVPAERRRLGYVSQEGSLFPHLSVEANVAFGLPRRERRGRGVCDLLDAVGLAEYRRRYPHELSGGQQQRVALARALAVHPQAVLLDEPFASLDAQLRASVRADVREILRSSGTTAVLVTHDQDEALSIADFVGVIRDGRIAQFAEPAELYTRPADADLARFVGAANLIEGRPVEGAVDTAFGRVPVVDLTTGEGASPVAVLVRPEQFEIAAPDSRLGEGGDGMRGHVLSTNFHGHDCLVRVQPDGPLEPFVVRALGDPRLPVGASVRLRIKGPVLIWAPPAPGTDAPEAKTAPA